MCLYLPLGLNCFVFWHLRECPARRTYALGKMEHRVACSCGAKGSDRVNLPVKRLILRMLLVLENSTLFCIFSCIVHLKSSSACWPPIQNKSNSFSASPPAGRAHNASCSRLRRATALARSPPPRRFWRLTLHATLSINLWLMSCRLNMLL